MSEKKATYFDSKNLVEGSSLEYASPSGRYRLVIERYSTGPHTWSYSQGSVHEGDRLIAVVQRNYGSFPFAFIEDHPNGHCYLICGEDYQGQTIIELDSGRRKDILSDGSDKGVGFCWAAYRFHAQTGILTVDGCIWACPYEYRFYDFSDPMSGWPEIKIEGEYVDADGKWPEVTTEKIRVFQTARDDDDDDEEDPETREIVAWTDFVLKGGQLSQIDAWVAETEKERRRLRDEASRRYEEWLKTFKSTDPLYLTMLEELKDPTFKPDEYVSIGVIHENWCDFYPMSDPYERRMCRRIHARQPRSPDYTIDLEWGVDKGPVKLVIFKDGNSYETKFFPEHSEKSVIEAFQYSRNLISGVS